MKPGSIVIASVLAYLGITALRKKGTADKLQFYVHKVAVRFSGLTPILDIILGVQNPTGEALRIGSIVGDLYINGSYVAAIAGYTMTDIKALSASYFPISARLSVFGVVSQAMDIVKAITAGGISSLVNQVLAFKGFVNAEGLTIPLDFSYKVL